MPAYFRPKTLGEALEIRASRPVTILAGGTDIYPAKTARAGWGDMQHADILDISAVEGPRGIEATEKHYCFGSLVTWTALRRATLPTAFAGYQAAAAEIGGAQIQNRATLVGNICTASPAGDGIPCLLTLDAVVELASRNGSRTVPIAEFIDGYRNNACRPDEIVTAILIPKPLPGARGSFIKLGARRYLVISIAMAAGLVTTADNGTIEQARIAVGACTPVAQRLVALEEALVGHTLAEAPEILSETHIAALTPIDDIRASGIFRRSAALGIVRDLLSEFSTDRRRSAA